MEPLVLGIRAKVSKTERKRERIQGGEERPGDSKEMENERENRVALTELTG